MSAGLGRALVIFREARTFVRQIGKPEGNGKVVTIGTDGAEYARLAAKVASPTHAD